MSLTHTGRLVVRCPDRPGIVAVLSRLMADAGANITDSQQHSSDPTGGTFTLRLEFERAAPVEVAVTVAPPGAAGQAGPHGAGSHTGHNH